MIVAFLASFVSTIEEMEVSEIEASECDVRWVIAYWSVSSGQRECGRERGRQCGGLRVSHQNIAAPNCRPLLTHLQMEGCKLEKCSPA